MPKIIINADDFGYSKIFNNKILELLENWFLKSTTVMVDFISDDQNEQVAKLVELSKTLDISAWLHIVFDLQKSLDEQIDSQFKKFTEIFWFSPSHLDIHKEKDPDCVNATIKYWADKNIPVRYITIEPITKHTTYPCLSNVPFDLHKSIEFIETLKDWESCEILCHPWEFDSDCKSSFNKDRIIDFDWVIKLNDYIANNQKFQIISYYGL